MEVSRRALINQDWTCNTNNGIDLHTNNIAFRIPDLSHLSEAEVLTLYSAPCKDPVKRKDGKPVGDQVPRYLIAPADLSHSTVHRALRDQPSVAVIDFGEAFQFSSPTIADMKDPLPPQPPRSPNTALAFRAPETIFGVDSLNHRVDLWAMGCIVSLVFFRCSVSSCNASLSARITRARTLWLTRSQMSFLLPLYLVTFVAASRWVID